MINEQYISLIMAYLKDSLSSKEKQQLDKLIEDGSIDRVDLKEMENIYWEIGSVKVHEPSESIRNRFYAMLDSEKAKQNHTSSGLIQSLLHRYSLRLNLSRTVLAVCIFLVGLLVGNWYTPSPKNEQIDRLTAEVHQLQETMLISLINNSSPTERLKAVNMSYEISSADHRVITALLETLNNDPNVNVRIAAVQALVNHADSPEVRTGLVSSIVTQQSPIVQVAMADAMLALQEKQSVQEFRKLLERNQLDNNVRTKLENTIAALN